MARIRRQDPLVGPQEGPNHSRISLSSPYKEMNRGMGAVASLTNQVIGPFTMAITAVTRSRLAVGFYINRSKTRSCAPSK